MEYENWTRKFTKTLKEWGFEPRESKATSHRQWVYDGSKTERVVIITVPTKIKSSSRAASVSNVKRQLREAGASKEALAEFSNYSLGLIEAERGDTTEILEDKLRSAVKDEATLIAAGIAFELAKAANDVNYTSMALADRRIEINQEKRIRELSVQIENSLLRRLRGLFNRHIEQHGPIEVGNVYDFETKRVELDASFVKEFGFLIDYAIDPTYDGINLNGHLVGVTLDHFQSQGERVGFSVRVRNDNEAAYIECYDGRSLREFRMPWLYQQNEDKLKAILKSVSTHQLTLELKSRLDDIKWED
jgi:hypothetical protein